MLHVRSSGLGSLIFGSNSSFVSWHDLILDEDDFPSHVFAMESESTLHVNSSRFSRVLSPGVFSLESSSSLVLAHSDFFDSLADVVIGARNASSVRILSVRFSSHSKSFLRAEKEVMVHINDSSFHSSSIANNAESGVGGISSLFECIGCSGLLMSRTRVSGDFSSAQTGYPIIDFDGSRISLVESIFHDIVCPQSFLVQVSHAKNFTSERNLFSRNNVSGVVELDTCRHWTSSHDRVYNCTALNSVISIRGGGGGGIETYESVVDQMEVASVCGSILSAKESTFTSMRSTRILDVDSHGSESICDSYLGRVKSLFEVSSGSSLDMDSCLLSSISRNWRSSSDSISSRDRLPPALTGDDDGEDDENSVFSVDHGGRVSISKCVIGNVYLRSVVKSVHSSSSSSGMSLPVVVAIFSTLFENIHDIRRGGLLFVRNASMSVSIENCTISRASSLSLSDEMMMSGGHEDGMYSDDDTYFDPRASSKTGGRRALGSIVDIDRISGDLFVVDGLHVRELSTNASLISIHRSETSVSMLDTVFDLIRGQPVSLLHFSSGVELNVSRLVIRDVHALRDTGVVVLDAERVSIRNTSFVGLWGVRAGALRIVSGSFVHLSDVLCASNDAMKSSGGCMLISGRSSVRVDSSLFLNNSALISGGAIASVDTSPSSLSLHRVYMWWNVARRGYGGGISVDMIRASGNMSSITVRETRFFENAAFFGGGGLSVVHADFLEDRKVHPAPVPDLEEAHGDSLPVRAASLVMRMDNCSLVGNVVFGSGGSGGGILVALTEHGNDTVRVSLLVSGCSLVENAVVGNGAAFGVLVQMYPSEPLHRVRSAPSSSRVLDSVFSDCVIFNNAFRGISSAYEWILSRSRLPHGDDDAAGGWSSTARGLWLIDRFGLWPLSDAWSSLIDSNNCSLRESVYGDASSLYGFVIPTNRSGVASTAGACGPFIVTFLRPLFVESVYVESIGDGSESVVESIIVEFALDSRCTVWSSGIVLTAIDSSVRWNRSLSGWGHCVRVTPRLWSGSLGFPRFRVSFSHRVSLEDSIHSGMHFVFVFVLFCFCRFVLLEPFFCLLYRSM